MKNESFITKQFQNGDKMWQINKFYGDKMWMGQNGAN